MLSSCFLDFSVNLGAFCHRTESDIFLFLLLFRSFNLNKSHIQSSNA